MIYETANMQLASYCVCTCDKHPFPWEAKQAGGKETAGSLLPHPLPGLTHMRTAALCPGDLGREHTRGPTGEVGRVGPCDSDSGHGVEGGAAGQEGSPLGKSIMLPPGTISSVSLGLSLRE